MRFINIARERERKRNDQRDGRCVLFVQFASATTFKSLLTLLHAHPTHRCNHRKQMHTSTCGAIVNNRQFEIDEFSIIIVIIELDYRTQVLHTQIDLLYYQFSDIIRSRRIASHTVLSNAA